MKKKWKKMKKKDKNTIKRNKIEGKLVMLLYTSALNLFIF